MNTINIHQEWELQAIDKIAEIIRTNFLVSNKKTVILQLSYEYSGIMAQLLAHKLSFSDEPIDIEPVNIPYKMEFEPVLHPYQLDPYDKFIIVDSGCLSGNNFTKIKNQLLNYGINDHDMFFSCIACKMDSIFKPNFCPIYFDKNQMVHFWWETRTTKFNR